MGGFLFFIRVGILTDHFLTVDPLWFVVTNHLSFCFTPSRGSVSAYQVLNDV
jgi:F0F1-type ATP synthase assembly protein I